MNRIVNLAHNIFILAVWFTAVPASGHSGHAEYNPSWLPPPVGITGTVKTIDQMQSDSVTDKRQADILPQSTAHYTTIDELRVLVTERLSDTFVYPVRAKKRGVEGTVKLLLDIDESGGLLACRETDAAPPLLRISAEQQIRSIFPLPVLLETPVYDFSVQIVYKLDQRSAG